MTRTRIGLAVLVVAVVGVAFAAGRPAAPERGRWAVQRPGRRVARHRRARGHARGEAEGLLERDDRLGVAVQGRRRLARSSPSTRASTSRGGELRYLPDKDVYQLTLDTADKETLDLRRAARRTRADAGPRRTTRRRRRSGWSSRFLHANRFLYRYEVKPAGTTVVREVTRSARPRRACRSPARRRPARVHRQRRPGHHAGHAQGQDLLRLLQRLPRRVQRQPREVHQGVREAKKNKK